MGRINYMCIRSFENFHGGVCASTLTWNEPGCTFPSFLEYHTHRIWSFLWLELSLGKSIDQVFHRIYGFTSYHLGKINKEFVLLDSQTTISVLILSSKWYGASNAHPSNYHIIFRHTKIVWGLFLFSFWRTSQVWVIYGMVRSMFVCHFIPQFSEMFLQQFTFTSHK